MPLAVGLFGSWGSGKSHFMNLMDQHMKRLARDTRDGQTSADAQWCKEIVPIYFNAWHYVDTNLWASLVTEIFDGLFAYLRPKQDQLKRVQDLLEKASGATARATEQLGIAVSAREHAESRLRTARTDLSEKQTALEGLKSGLWSLLPKVCKEDLKGAAKVLGIEHELSTIGDIDSTWLECRSLIGRLRALCNDPHKGWLLTRVVTYAVVSTCLAWMGLHRARWVDALTFVAGESTRQSLSKSAGAKGSFTQRLILGVGRFPPSFAT